MNLYIETENGAIKNHPAFEDNLIQAFGSVPAHWEPFIRVERPILGVYELMTEEEPTYEKVNGVWTDVWIKRDMTAEEKTDKQQAVKNAWVSNNGFASWTFSEATCVFEAPTPMPTDDKRYSWNEDQLAWIET
jgi:hypothetical protein